MLSGMTAREIGSLRRARGQRDTTPRCGYDESKSLSVVKLLVLTISLALLHCQISAFKLIVKPVKQKGSYEYSNA